MDSGNLPGALGVVVHFPKNRRQLFNRIVLTMSVCVYDLLMIQKIFSSIYDGVCGKLEKLVVKPSQILGNIHRLNAERLVIQTTLCFQNYQIVTGM